MCGVAQSIQNFWSYTPIRTNDVAHLNQCRDCINNIMLDKYETALHHTKLFKAQVIEVAVDNPALSMKHLCELFGISSGVASKYVNAYYGYGEKHF